MLALPLKLYPANLTFLEQVATRLANAGVTKDPTSEHFRLLGPNGEQNFPDLSRVCRSVLLGDVGNLLATAALPPLPRESVLPRVFMRSSGCGWRTGGGSFHSTLSHCWPRSLPPDPLPTPVIEDAVFTNVDPLLNERRENYHQMACFLTAMISWKASVRAMAGQVAGDPGLYLKHGALWYLKDIDNGDPRNSQWPFFGAISATCAAYAVFNAARFGVPIDKAFLEKASTHVVKLWRDREETDFPDIGAFTRKVAYASEALHQFQQRVLGR